MLYFLFLFDKSFFLFSLQAAMTVMMHVILHSFEIRKKKKSSDSEINFLIKSFSNSQLAENRHKNFYKPFDQYYNRKLLIKFAPTNKVRNRLGEFKWYQSGYSHLAIYQQLYNKTNEA